MGGQKVVEAPPPIMALLPTVGGGGERTWDVVTASFHEGADNAP